MINLKYKLKQTGGNNLKKIIKECNMSQKDIFLNKEFCINNNYVDLDINRFNTPPFKEKPQVPLFHSYNTLTTPFTVFKLDNYFFKNIPTSLKTIANSNFDEKKIDIFFVINYETGYENENTLFRPHYYYLPHNGVRGGDGENIQFNPYAGIYENNKQISSTTKFINNFIQIGGLSAHDNKISSSTHPMNWHGNKPISLYSIVNGPNGEWSKCAITLHWIVDFSLAKDFRDKAKLNNNFKKLLPILKNDSQYNDLISSLEQLLS